jgi:hypothetical protein
VEIDTWEAGATGDTMPKFILKVEPGPRDRYMLWSTVSDAPYSIGTREEVTADLDSADERHPDRFARADATGTSAYDGDYGFADTGAVYLNDWLPRQNFSALADRIEGSGFEVDVSDLVQPCDE